MGSPGMSTYSPLAGCLCRALCGRTLSSAFDHAQGARIGRQTEIDLALFICLGRKPSNLAWAGLAWPGVSQISQTSSSLAWPGLA